MTAVDRPATLDGSPETRDALQDFLGLRWEGDPGIASLTIKPHLVNSAGLLLGPVVFAMLDYCMGAALWAQTTANEWIATIHVSVSYVSSAVDGEVMCRTRVDRRNSRTGLVRGELHHQDGRLLATAQGTYAITKPRH